MGNLDNAEKGVGYVQRFFDFLYNNRRRREKIDKLIAQYEKLQKENTGLHKQDLDFIQQLTSLTSFL